MMKLFLIGVVTSALLSGCAEPFTESRGWHATGVSEANMNAQTVDKADTVAGHGSPGSDAVLDAAAIKRLYDDKAKQLPTETTTSGVTQ